MLFYFVQSNKSNTYCGVYILGKVYLLFFENLEKKDDWEVLYVESIQNVYKLKTSIFNRRE